LAKEAMRGAWGWEERVEGLEEIDRVRTGVNADMDKVKKGVCNGTVTVGETNEPPLE
jgi:hypothetical protein